MDTAWHLAELYENDKSKGSGIAMFPKLKFEHIQLTSFSKMRGDLAAEVYLFFYHCFHSDFFCEFLVIQSAMHWRAGSRSNCKIYGNVKQHFQRFKHFQYYQWKSILETYFTSAPSLWWWKTASKWKSLRHVYMYIYILITVAGDGIYTLFGRVGEEREWMSRF